MIWNETPGGASGCYRGGQAVIRTYFSIFLLVFKWPCTSSSPQRGTHTVISPISGAHLFTLPCQSQLEKPDAAWRWP